MPKKPQSLTAADLAKAIDSIEADLANWRDTDAPPMIDLPGGIRRETIPDSIIDAWVKLGELADTDDVEPPPSTARDTVLAIELLTVVLRQFLAERELALCGHSSVRMRFCYEGPQALHAAHGQVVASQKPPRDLPALPTILEMTAEGIPARQQCVTYRWFTEDGQPDLERHRVASLDKDFVPPPNPHQQARDDARAQAWSDRCQRRQLATRRPVAV